MGKGPSMHGGSTRSTPVSTSVSIIHPTCLVYTVQTAPFSPLISLLTNHSLPHSCQQVQPPTQLHLRPNQSRQIPNTQHLLQSLLDTLLPVIIDRVLRLPSSNSFKQVSPNLRVRGCFAGDNRVDVGLDLSEVGGEGG